MRLLRTLAVVGGLVSAGAVAAVAADQSAAPQGGAGATATAQAPKPSSPTTAAPTGQQPVAAPQTTPRAGTQTPPRPTPQAPKGAAPIVRDSVSVPTDYVIGIDDVVAVLFWREKDMSVEQVSVRPDGRITLPLLNDVVAAGLTPEQLRESVEKAAAAFVEDPTATIVIRQINSRRFFVTGMVAKPGPYPLAGPTTVLQAIATAGGVQEYASENKIVILRTEGGKTRSFPFRMGDVMKGKKLDQNIVLRPGDTVVVP